MLAARLRTLAWLSVPLALTAITAATTLDLPQLISDHRALFSVAAHWLPFIIAGLVLALPLACAPWADLTSATKRRSTRLAALAVGLLGAALVCWFGEAEFKLREFETCCDLAQNRPVGLFIVPWLGVVLLGQSHLIEIVGARGGRARARRSLTLALAWLGSFGLVMLAPSTMLGMPTELLVPVALMLGVDFGVRWAARLGPQLHKQLHERRETNRTLHRLVTEVSHSPDPAALAQGHQLNRLTRYLRLAALASVGILSLLWLDTNVALQVGVASVIGLVAVLGWAEQSVLHQIATPPPGPDRSDDGRLPTELRPILTHVDSCAEQLEQAQDASFNEALMELALMVSDLDRRTLETFDRHGVDPRRLIQQLFDSEGTIGAAIEPERRRALHHQLRKFAAQIRGQVHLDPYRADLPGAIGAVGLGWLRGGQSPLDPDLSRTRRRLALGLSALVFGIFTLAQAMGAAQSEHPLAVCIPGMNPYCEWGFASGDTATILGTLAALTPVWLWLGARLAQWAAQLSFLLSLPPEGELEPNDAMIRRLMWSAWTDRVAVGAGERWVFALLAGLLLAGLPSIGATVLQPSIGSSDLAAALIAGPLLGLALLAMYPLRRLHAHVVSLLVD